MRKTRALRFRASSRLLMSANSFRMLSRRRVLLLLALAVGLTVALSALPRVASAGAVRPGFDANTLLRNDDGSTSLVDIGFTVNFFGTDYTDLYVNNNGNVTFRLPLGTYTPFSLTTTAKVIIAPFFADVDTRSAGEPVKYGTGEVSGRSAFGVSWRDVDCFFSSPARTVRNFFQMILIDRSDISPGDFDIEFNYDQIEWETGEASDGSFECLGGFSARVGYSNGANASFELFGSGIPGSFLDSNMSTGLIHNSLLNGFPFEGPGGRYVFEVRNGTPPLLAVPPTAMDDSNILFETIVYEDTSWSFPASDLTDNDSPEGLIVTEVSATSSAGGTVVLSGGTVTYTPPPDFNSDAGVDDSFTYTACNDSSQCATGRVFVTVAPVNDPPVFDPIADQTVFTAQAPNVAITGVSPGPENEACQQVTLTATAVSVPLLVGPGITNLIISPATGTASTRTLSYTRVSGATGQVHVKVEAQDNGATCGEGPTILSVDGNATSDPWIFTITLGNPAGEPTGSVVGGSAPGSAIGYGSDEPIVVKAACTYYPIDFTGDGQPDCYFVPRTELILVVKLDGEDPESHHTTLAVTYSPSPEDLIQVCATPQTFFIEVVVTDLFPELENGPHVLTATCETHGMRDPDVQGGVCTSPSGCFEPVLQATSETFTTLITVGAQCSPPTNPGAGGTGCPFADKNTVTLHTVRYYDRRPTRHTTQPLPGILVRVFDRNNSAFQAVVRAAGGMNLTKPRRALYGVIFEANLELHQGLVGTCVTASNGMCFAGEEQKGEYLVIVKYVDPETQKTVYAGKRKSPKDFKKNGVAERNFRILKVFKNDRFQEERDEDKEEDEGK